MKKSLTFLTSLFLFASLFFFQTHFSSCTKSKTITDTVIKVVTDTVPVIKLDSGLIAYYAFSGNVKDSTSNHNDGNITGNLAYTTDFNSKANSAALFDGVTTYIIVPDNGTLSTPSMSISLQFYVTSTAHQTLVAKNNFADATSPVFGSSLFGGSGVDNQPYSANFAVHGPSVACGAPEAFTNDELVYTQGPIQTNTWYQITFTFDKGVEKVYLNGVLAGALTRTFTTLKSCTQASFNIGGFWTGGKFLFQGKMDEIRVYNRALNRREIKMLAAGF